MEFIEFLSELVDLRVINTTAILAVLGALWRMHNKLQTIHQAFFGVDGRNGVLKRLEILEGEIKTVDKRIADSRHTIRGEVQEKILELEEELKEHIDHRLKR